MLILRYCRRDPRSPCLLIINQLVTCSSYGSNQPQRAKQTNEGYHIESSHGTRRLSSNCLLVKGQNLRELTVFYILDTGNYHIRRTGRISYVMDRQCPAFSSGSWGYNGNEQQRERPSRCSLISTEFQLLLPMHNMLQSLKDSPMLLSNPIDSFESARWISRQKRAVFP